MIQKLSIQLKSAKKSVLKAETAKVLAYNQDRNPAFICNNYGKGKIYYLNYPMEKYITNNTGIFNADNESNYWKVYNIVKQNAPTSKVLLTTSTKVGFTEHIVDENTRMIVAINYFPSKEYIDIKLKEGWAVSKVYYGK